MVNLTRISLSLNALFLCMLYASCATPIAQPPWEGKIWAGSSEVAGIERRQDQQIISCMSKDFDNYAAISYRDLGCLYEQVILNVEKYKDPGKKCSGSVTEGQVLFYLEHVRK